MGKRLFLIFQKNKPWGGRRPGARFGINDSRTSCGKTENLSFFVVGFWNENKHIYKIHIIQSKFEYI